MKINNDSIWQFYNAYHEDRYIISHDARKKVTLKEKGEKSKYILRNDSEKDLVIYRIDGGIITSKETKKCDYGIYTEQDVLFLIELKGSDYNHALDQIISTIDILLKKPSVKVKQLNVRVILSKCRIPNILVTQEKKLNNLLKTKYGNGSICKQTKVFEEHI
jgi:hypothetical protein